MQTLSTSGLYVPSDITIQEIPSNYYDMSGDYSFLGLNAEHVGTFYTDSFTLDDTTFSSWTASTTATKIGDTIATTQFTADIDNYDYWIRWRYQFTAQYLSGVTLKLIPIRQVFSLWQCVQRRPSNLTMINQGTENYTYCTTAFTSSSYTRYYNSSGNEALGISVSYGIYPSITAPTIASASTTSPKITPNTPSIYARCHSTYFATSRKAYIDTASPYKIIGDLFRVKRGTSMVRNFFRDAEEMVITPI